MRHTSLRSHHYSLNPFCNVQVLLGVIRARADLFVVSNIGTPAWVWDGVLNTMARLTSIRPAPRYALHDLVHCRRALPIQGMYTFPKIIISCAVVKC